MRTNDLKYIAERYREEYEDARSEAIQEWKDGDMDEDFYFPDVYEWVGMNILTAEEEIYEYRREEGLL